MADQLRDELAETIHQLHDADALEVADAVLASPVIASLKAEAWDQGYHAGRKYVRRY
jgi:hypothetical protein